MQNLKVEDSFLQGTFGDQKYIEMSRDSNQKNDRRTKKLLHIVLPILNKLRKG